MSASYFKSGEHPLRDRGGCCYPIKEPRKQKRLLEVSKLLSLHLLVLDFVHLSQRHEGSLHRWLDAEGSPWTTPYDSGAQEMSSSTTLGSGKTVSLTKIIEK